MQKKGLVIKAIASFFYVSYAGEILECRASKKLKLNKEKIITGDNVIFNLEEKYIVAIEERKNELIRPKIANVNNAILVFSATEPVMNFGLLDRMILIMEMNNLKTHILVTKTDLLSLKQRDKLFERYHYYQKIGYKVFDSNIVSDVEKFKKLLNADKFVFTGQTGVGKSTFINQLLPELELKTQEISKALGRGKHTTREIEFYNFNESYIIDTPGFSSLDITFSVEDVRDNYHDFIELSEQCRFNMCYHVQEPNCHVKKIVELSCDSMKERYKNYVKLIVELRS